MRPCLGELMPTRHDWVESKNNRGGRRAANDSGGIQRGDKRTSHESNGVQ